MKIVVLSGSIIGTKTLTAMKKTVEILEKKYPQHEVVLLDLAAYKIEFSDGRQYFEYDGDTKYVTETVMDADALIIGRPIFQASIPATLKNIFDLLPVNAFRDKVVGTVVIAGAAKNFLIVEQQLKPIFSYMKAHIVPTDVSIYEENFLRKQIVNE